MEDSAAMRRRLRVELRRLRTAADLTQREVADALEWSPSKIIRIESGQVGITVTDLKALVGHYGLNDPDEVAALTELARGSKRQPFVEFRDVLTAETIKFLGYEASASRILQAQPSVVPGTLQTEEYSRALLKGYGRSAKAIDRVLESRRDRQEVLERDPAPELSFMLDEAILRRQVGGPGVMRNQFNRLLELSERPNITIRIIPFEVGAYEALRGPFVLLEFPEASDPDVVYLEYSRGPSTFTDDPGVAADYQERFLALEDLAAPAARFPEYIERALRTFSTDLASTSEG
ncbi:helix-turn-helix domain-containing protein [Pseudonocardia lacus]|uniref:helix-turn-helix domain-containing protein n=1 Tax=Pseudonocardia lacus TaxID=2835865 RepID=UPI001BDC9CBF|nr:helix-turn-helix transcriptional regulator [Pseudonocardia lacus]